MKILIVDDYKPSRIIQETYLRSAGYEDILTAQSARDAMTILTSIRRKGKGPAVDLVLMDIMMPEMDGIAATRLIKSVKFLADIPIIMVTAESEQESLERAFDAGAIDYIHKPVNKIELRTRVRSLLKLKEQIDARKAQERELMALTLSLEDANAKLVKLSTLDGLTGMANRRFFDETFQKEWSRGARNGLPLGLIMADLDYFKAYNDLYGHVKGDGCLVRVAEALAAAVKRPEDFLARYGGEEFVALLPSTDMNGAVQVSNLMRANVSDLCIEHLGSKVCNKVTISLGVSAIVPTPTVHPSRLVESADQALYAAKEGGRNRVKVCPLADPLPQRNEQRG